MNILDENDEKPICIPNSYFLAVPVDLKVGTNIQNFKLTCTDRDSSPRSFRYSIGPGIVPDINSPGPALGVRGLSRCSGGMGWGLSSHTNLGTVCMGRRKAGMRGVIVPVSPSPPLGFPFSHLTLLRLPHKAAQMSKGE